MLPSLLGCAGRALGRVASRPRFYALSQSGADGGGLARLPVVPFDKTKLNSITLTGNVGIVERKAIRDTTKTSLRVAYNERARVGQPPPETIWFNVEAWGELAEQVAAEVRKGMKVVVSGRLEESRWTDAASQQPRTAQYIRAFSIALLEPLPERVPERAEWQEPPKAAPATMSSPAPAAAALADVPKAGSPAASSFSDKPAAKPARAVDAQPARPAYQTDKAVAEDLIWRDLLYHKDQWYDNRASKTGRQPDFKKKDGSTALWLDSKLLPSWATEYFGARDESPPREWDSPSPEENDAGSEPVDQGKAPF